jgi:DNA modification methylase
MDEDQSMNVLDQSIGDKFALYNGDCVEVMRGIPDASVHYSVFSPPFSSLYTYSSSPRDMGNVSSHAEFFEQHAFMVRELYRVLMPGRLVSFHCMLFPTNKTRDGFIGLYDFRGDLIRQFMAEGFVFHSEVVIWKDPVTAMQRTKALGLLHKQIKKDSAMSRQGVPDYVITMRKPGDNTEPVTHTDETFPVELWQRYASPVWVTTGAPDPEGFSVCTADIDATDTLQYRSAREHEDERHICPLQLEVIRRAVRLWSNPGDVVLSPFAGIGSEGYVSIQEGRRFIGAELKASYYRQAAANLRAAENPPQRDLFG